MSRGDWHRHVAYVGLASVVVGAIVAPILVTAQDQWRDRQKYEQQTQAAYQEAGVRFSLLSEVDQTASTDARERAREDREHSDLSAQWATAGWTLAQFIVGLVGLAATVGALTFAYLAWKATKAGVEVTRDIGVAQTRAYLSIPAAEIIFHPNDSFGINLHIKNSGTSPALNVEAIVHPASFLKAATNEQGFKAASGPVVPDGKKEKTQIGDLGPSELVDNAAVLPPNKAIPSRDSFNAFVCKVSLNYRTVFMKEVDAPETLDVVLIGVELSVPAKFESNMKAKLMCRSVGTMFKNLPIAEPRDKE